ncbi:hypothetical protein SCOCK_70253 [Actinacidiphila cocklensis]|uniref:Uncharacterized protein n=1 Tax=Actinacidiphila cocklensis TaxID=887465 RepID=A0A9W4EBH6_9ACTN|nr:hypothetical protein SCOCK_70253 [Actinacidiphila cocklensis]
MFSLPAQLTCTAYLHSLAARVGCTVWLHGLAEQMEGARRPERRVGRGEEIGVPEIEVGYGDSALGRCATAWLGQTCWDSNPGPSFLQKEVSVACAPGTPAARA